MRKIIIPLILSFVFTGELEVDGNLTVTEGVNASSFVGDGSGLTNLPSLGDMKPDRIYTFIQTEGGPTVSASVPGNKVWRILPTTTSGNSIEIDGIYHDDFGDQVEFWLLPNQTLTTLSDSPFFFTIFEFSISSTGSEQGLNYVVR